MTLFSMHIAVFVLLLWGMRLEKGGFREDFLGKAQCDAIKGLSIAYVFAAHIVPYMKGGGYELVHSGDICWKAVTRCTGQLCVVMFLFYSGYGVMESFKKKGLAYARSMPLRRIGATLLNFDVAVLAFLALGLALGKRFSLKRILLSFTGWESIGNSNWYIFVILLCYAAAWAVFSLRGAKAVAGKKLPCWLCIGAVCAAFSFALSFCKTSNWYQTTMAFPFGVMVSERRDAFVSFAKRHYRPLLAGAAALFLALDVATVVFRSALGVRPLATLFFYNALSIVFAVLVVLVTMKVKIGNAALLWLGANLFPIYIYQRIPMWGFARMMSGGRNIALYIVFCAAATLAIAWLYRFWRISFSKSVVNA